jgi:hypothetical protein
MHDPNLAVIDAYQAHGFAAFSAQPEMLQAPVSHGGRHEKGVNLSLTEVTQLTPAIRIGAPTDHCGPRSLDLANHTRRLDEGTKRWIFPTFTLCEMTNNCASREGILFGSLFRTIKRYLDLGRCGDGANAKLPR